MTMNPAFTLIELPVVIAQSSPSSSSRGTPAPPQENRRSGSLKGRKGLVEDPAERSEGNGIGRHGGPIERRVLSKRAAFTLIELLVVIAIIAILAAILFPVFARAKESAKATKSLAQMRQLAAGVMLYAGDHDDHFVPASNRPANPAILPIIWTEGIEPYLKNKDLLVAEGSNGAYAANWNERRHQSVGYNDATGYDSLSAAVPGAAPAGTEGFNSAATFGQVEESASVGLFATTPNAPKGVTTTKHRGYVFNPYNGLNDPDGVYKKGLPMVADRDLVVESGEPRYPNSPTLLAGALKPIFCRYFADKSGAGRSPIIFADGHTKSYSANELNVFGKVVWRFR